MEMKLDNPIKTTTFGGYSATITTLVTDDVDCMTGTIYFPNGDTKNASWSRTCFCRDSSKECNLKGNSPELEELFSLIDNGFKL